MQSLLIVLLWAHYARGLNSVYESPTEYISVTLLDTQQLCKRSKYERNERYLWHFLNMPDWLTLSVAITLVISVVSAYLLYSGLLSDITVLTGPSPIKKVTFAYKFREGPYKNCGQLFKESHKIGPNLSCIGVFYDDPKKVKHYTTLLVERQFLRCFFNVLHITDYFCLNV